MSTIFTRTDQIHDGPNQTRRPDFPAPLLLCLFLVMLPAMALSGGQREGSTSAQPDGVQQALEGNHRSVANRARDDARKPGETLTFWGFQPDMTVVEVWPGGGWYTEILAPSLRDRGKLIAANFPDDAKPDWRAAMAREYREKLAAHPQVYDQVKIVPFDPPAHPDLAPSGSADMVILSRHFHNFILGGIVDEVLSASRRALRPGGVLAIVQHRAKPDATPEAEQRTGYVREQWLVKKVESAGFILKASSPLNHNPRDSREHEDEVWSLPPSLRTCKQLADPSKQIACRKKYTAIGESDRMTLRFIRQ
ncbi:hypothetical protein MA04_03615 [Alcanivorax balearicus MACL04]|uniref:Methyltransferase type 11 domain-containing protein n=1 Tax=Alloalcanivorax balearicus MACL04 TaxID=1177182 RepID=A0ABT2R3G0_9GAMM|nr:methyltransferase type 12 [Alloalcanivorax balearicus]MCU5784315.1 hypothetical protein [Alloalcanivorax balearicus MACL04]